MKQKKLVSILCLALAVIMLLSLFISVLPTRAYAVSQSDIDELKARRAEIGIRVAQAQERLEGLQSEQSDVLVAKNALEEQNRAAQEALELVAQEIAMYDQMILEKNSELEDAVNREMNQLYRYRTRVRAMEENGGYNVIALFLESTSFGELLTALDDMGEIMENDQQLEQQYRAAREDVERIKAEYEALRLECQSRKAELETEKLAIEGQIAETNAQLEALAASIAEAEAAYEQEMAAEEAAAAEVTAMIARYEAEQRAIREEEARRAAAAAAAAAAAQQGPSSSNVSDNSSSSSSAPSAAPVASTGFGWPCPSWNGYITGRYGETRPGHFHAGIDIDGYGCDGAPIVAAAAGTVITATSSGGYGNYVLIDHGNGYQTLYAHMSGLAVSSGAYVSQGQTIGYMGASGNASGTHCHFEIRINGATTDPEAWFPGLAHWNC